MPYQDAVVDAVFLEEKATPRQKAIAYAIAQAENDPKGLYGVRSVHVTDRKGAARVLLNSIRNNERRFTASGSKGDFVDFMGKRWAPGGAKNDPRNLNAYWPRNVRYFLKHNGKEAQ